MEDDSVPQPPWKRAAVGRRAKQSEEATAKSDGGQGQPASGSKWYAKGDVRANGFLIDDKFTDSDSFRITRPMVEKGMVEALQTPPGLRAQWRISIPGIPRLRVLLEDDYLFLVAKAGVDG